MKPEHHPEVVKHRKETRPMAIYCFTEETSRPLVFDLDLFERNPQLEGEPSEYHVVAVLYTHRGISTGEERLTTVTCFGKHYTADDVVNGNSVMDVDMICDRPSRS